MFQSLCFQAISCGILSELEDLSQELWERTPGDSIHLHYPQCLSSCYCLSVVLAFPVSKFLSCIPSVPVYGKTKNHQVIMPRPSSFL